MKAKIEMGKAKAKDDLERDQMLQDGRLKEADLIGKYGIAPVMNGIINAQNTN